MPVPKRSVLYLRSNWHAQENDIFRMSRRIDES